MTTPHEEPLCLRLSQLISEQRHELEQRWLAIVAADVERTPELELTQLRDGMPDYLAALARTLATGELDLERRGHDAWAGIARHHGITRVRHGFDIGQLMHEFIVLHRVIRDAAARSGVHGVQHLLSEAIESAMAESVKAYVEARDYAARRTQAENVGFITHELRNPLTGAIIAAKRLRRDAAAGQLHLLDTLDRSHGRLLELIDGVLLNERLESGEVSSQPRRLRLDEVMRDALEAAREVAREKGLDFEARYDPRLELVADPVLTRAAIANLADNAVKYTDHGAVDIDVEARPETVEVHVRDNCPGLSGEELATIFQPFRRGATQKSGSGLGLAIARRAIEVQGGEIHAESPGPAGCHFWFSLPRDLTRH